MGFETRLRAVWGGVLVVFVITTGLLWDLLGAANSWKLLNGSPSLQTADIAYRSGVGLLRHPQGSIHEPTCPTWAPYHKALSLHYKEPPKMMVFEVEGSSLHANVVLYLEVCLVVAPVGHAHFVEPLL